MTPTTTILIILVAIIAILAVVLVRRRAAPRPPTPTPLDPSTDPTPTRDDIETMDARLSATDNDLDDHNAAHPRDDHDRPALPPDFSLDAPDDDVVDVLRRMSGD